MNIVILLLLLLSSSFVLIVHHHNHDLSFIPTITCSPVLTNNTIRIGFLSSFRYGLGKIIAGAVPLAIKDLNSDDSILPNHSIDFIGKFFSFCFEKLLINITMMGSG
ncbi:hypothetical protein BLA29_000271 [Euroglyphus maynei]|uniref:Uncharacterized protein n=1 Tax=Euroglyphus maynei TaxID=6958 RepID=A0A1Y3BVX1_EURMA|nr:hypothetical protein BLA29_000271 [Euroglyphus maynei]